MCIVCILINKKSITPLEGVKALRELIVLDDSLSEATLEHMEDLYQDLKDSVVL